MINLLSVEWMKIKGYRTFWVLAAFFVASIIGINYFFYYIKQVTIPDTGMANAIIGTPFSFPNVWHTVTYISSFLLFLPGLMIITSVTNEFVYRTNRQNIIDGWSRREFIHVKMLLVVLLALFSTLFVFLTALVLGAVTGGTLNIDKLEFLFYYFVQALSYGMVALGLSVFIKRSGLAIGIFFLYSFVIENALGGFLSYKTRDAGKFSALGDYLPLNVTDALIPFPFLRNIVKLQTEHSVYVLLTVSGVYLLIYYFFSKKKFTQTDL
ncbi:hypothetical protein BH09BAC2_BH09BAC2_21380 [soil metagenome]